MSLLIFHLSIIFHSDLSSLIAVSSNFDCGILFDRGILSTILLRQYEYYDTEQNWDEEIQDDNANPYPGFQFVVIFDCLMIRYYPEKQENQITAINLCFEDYILLVQINYQFHRCSLNVRW